MILFSLLALATAADLAPWVQSELEGALAAWEGMGTSPHYVAVTVEDRSSSVLSYSAGACERRDTDRARLLDVDLRLGTPARDSTHTLRGASQLDDDERGVVRLPYEGPSVEAALRHGLRKELDARYRNARERLALLAGEASVLVEEEDPAPDFEPRTGVRVEARRAKPSLDEGAWTVRLQRASEILDAAPFVVDSAATLRLEHRERLRLDTEGGWVDDGWTSVRLVIEADVVAEDGDALSVTRIVDEIDPAALPDEAGVLALAQEVVREAEALREAPRAGPHTGPVLLSGRAAAVFLHEVLGHRAEGDRNKRDDEGKTFLEQLGKRVLPPWIDVVDDPTLSSLQGEPLRGHYAADDEGVPAERAVLVEDGIFRGFLMGRSPLSVQEHSNGHGRRSTGRPPMARMGVTILTAAEQHSDAELRARLRELLREQGLEYGYVVDEIEGGFTLTGRVIPNAFNVRASRTWRVFEDGRADELVRGIDLVGTPLAAFRAVVAAGDTPEVFNGTCGAESGWVPVSAVSPALLFRRLELQLKEKSVARPPLLPKPVVERERGA